MKTDRREEFSSVTTLFSLLKHFPCQVQHIARYKHVACAEILLKMDIWRRTQYRRYNRVERPWNVLSMSATLPSETAAQVIASCIMNKLLRGFRGDKVH